MSNTTITGNLGRDAELKFIPSGAAVLEMSVGDTPRRKTDSGWEDAGPCVWYRVSIWGPFAEAIANSGVAVKGARVIATGVFTPREYSKDGATRVSYDVKAETIGFPESRGGGQQSRVVVESRPMPNPWGSSSNDVAPF